MSNKEKQNAKLETADDLDWPLCRLTSLRSFSEKEEDGQSCWSDGMATSLERRAQGRSERGRRGQWRSVEEKIKEGHRACGPPLGIQSLLGTNGGCESHGLSFESTGKLGKPALSTCERLYCMIARQCHSLRYRVAPSRQDMTAALSGVVEALPAGWRNTSHWTPRAHSRSLAAEIQTEHR